MFYQHERSGRGRGCARGWWWCCFLVALYRVVLRTTVTIPIPPVVLVVVAADASLEEPDDDDDDTTEFPFPTPPSTSTLSTNNNILIQASFWKTPISTIHSFQCFSFNVVAHHAMNHDACCQAIENLLLYLQQQQQTQNNKREEEQERKMEWLLSGPRIDTKTCHAEIHSITVPKLLEVSHNNKNNDIDTDNDETIMHHIPKVVWTTTLYHDRTTKKEDSFENAASNDSNPRILLNSHDCPHFLWNNDKGTGLWMEPPPGGHWTFDPSSTIAQEWKNWFPSPKPKRTELEETKNDDSDKVNASIRKDDGSETANTNNACLLFSKNMHVTSNISPTGGMHRRWHHQLQSLLQILNDDDSIQNSYSFSITVLAQIPLDCFINVEDAYELVSFHVQPSVEPEQEEDDDDNNKNNNDKPTIPCLSNVAIQLVTNENVLMDQEQPAFLSPSHTILYQIQGIIHTNNNKNKSNNNNTKNTEYLIQIHWDTLLHLRYPQPIPPPPSTRSNPQPASPEPWLWVTLLPLYVVQVTSSYHSFNQDAAVADDDQSHQRIGTTTCIPVSSSFLFNHHHYLEEEAQGRPIQFKIATGYAADLLPVLIVTLASSLVGTAFLWHAMSQILA